MGRLVAPTVAGYRRRWLVNDALAGLTLVAIAVPEQMATAHLANLAALAGLYAFVAGSVLYALFGRNGRVSVGADSTIAPVLASGVAAVAPVGSPRYGPLMALLALMIGGLVAGAGLLRLGWVAEFLSAPVITGVLAGIAIEIVVRQLPALLGVSGSDGSTLRRLGHLATHLGATNGWALGIGLGVLALTLAGEAIDRRIPGALIASVAALLLVAGFHLGSHGVVVVGTLHGGLPRWRWPGAGFGDAGRLIAPALAAAFLCLAQTAATVRTASAGAPAAGAFNADLVAVGAGSLAAGLSGAFAVNASPPRTQVVASSGGRTQVSGVVAAGAVLALAVFGAGLLRDLPQAALAAILLYVARRLFRVSELAAILRFDRIEFGLAILTMASIVFIGIEPGVIIAMLLSLADRVRLSARPRDAVLGREPGTDHWIPPDVGLTTEQVPGVIVYMLYAPLWYANADYVRLRVSELVEASPVPVKVLVLDADGMSDIDYTGTRALGQLASELKARGIITAVARASHLVHHDLKHSGLLADIGPEHLYRSVEEAVQDLAPR